MTKYLQLHYLTVYPPSNPNRDDLGRPKTAIYGGKNRLRISSQSLKRAIRTSDIMQAALKGQMGQRTRRIGEEVQLALQQSGISEEDALAAAGKVIEVFGKVDQAALDGGRPYTRQLAFVSPEEKSKAIEWANKAAAGEELPTATELKKLILQRADGAADVAMFGRMLADATDYNREAAVQIAHAITTHRADVENDFYTAVDDLNRGNEDLGAGFVGDAEFGSGVYYLYACIDCDLLEGNLAGDNQLASTSTKALVEALAKVSPGGKQASFAHRPRAGYIRAEFGSDQPRSLAGAFFKPVGGEDVMQSSITALEAAAEQMDKAYGPAADRTSVLNVSAGAGSLEDIIRFVEDCFSNG